MNALTPTLPYTEYIPVLEDVPVTQLVLHPYYPFADHSPELDRIRNDIFEHGLLQPLVTHLLPDGTYQILSGGQRYYACQSLGYTHIPCFVLPTLNEEDASQLMFDSILVQRRDIMTSQLAQMATSMMALRRHQGQKQDGDEESSAKSVAHQLGITVNELYCLLRAVNLIPPLRIMLDGDFISLSAASTISSLPEDLQSTLAEKMEQPKAQKLTCKLAAQMVELHSQNHLTPDVIDTLLFPSSTAESKPLTLKFERKQRSQLASFVDLSSSPDYIALQILELLQNYCPTLSLAKGGEGNG